MRYFIRALKYLVYFAVMFFIIVGIVYLYLSMRHTAVEGGSFLSLFKEGALPKIAVFFVAIAAIYPKLSFYKKEIHLNGDFTKYAEMFNEVMESMGYVLENREPGRVTYIKKGFYDRFSRMYEDRITFDTTDNPVIAEGYRKDLVRILSAINYRVRYENPGQEEA